MRAIDRAGPRSRLGWRPGDILGCVWHRSAGLLGITREDHHLISFGDQLLAQRPADHPGRACDDHALVVCHTIPYLPLEMILRHLTIAVRFLLFVVRFFARRAKNEQRTKSEVPVTSCYVTTQASIE